MSDCNCELCEFHRRVKSVIAGRNPDQLIALVNEMHEAALNMGHDLDFYKCVHDGSWPSAVEVLGRALGRAINKSAAAKEAGHAE